MATAIYRRLTKALDEDPETGKLDERNLVAQENELRTYAKGEGWTDIRVYTESGISSGKASEAKRPVFYGELVRDIEAGQIERVLFWHTDRAGRYQTALLRFADLCEERGVDIIVPSQGIHLRPGDDRLVFAMHGAIAESESRTRSRRAKAYRQRYAQAGRTRLGGFRRYGYEPNGVTLRPKEVRLVQQAADAVLAGKSLGSIASKWYEAGIRSSRGKPVAPKSIRNTLLTSDLIEEDQRERIRAVLNDPARRGNRAGLNKRTYLLSGLTFCVECGSKMAAYSGYSERQYRCRRNATEGTFDACGRVRVAADVLEGLVRTAVRDMFQFEKKMPRGEDASMLSAEKARLQARRNEVADAFAAEEMTREQMRRANQRIAEQERALDERLRAVPPAPVAIGEPPPDSDFQAWRAVVEYAVNRVEVREDGTSTVEFTWQPDLPEEDFERMVKKFNGKRQ